MKEYERIRPIARVVAPVSKFIQKQTTGGIILMAATLLAIILANSPLSGFYHHFFQQTLGFTFNNATYFNFTFHHWINDALMSIFFFAVGLELKREIVGGELSKPKKAMVPIMAAFGGMLFPALIYIGLNPVGDVSKGWGIPMATDIAFALGIIYLLGDRVPASLKVFLTALAIADDLGAVLVIAFFYTSEISIESLVLGLGFVGVMYAGNRMGVRHVLFYAVTGILGVWMAFLVSGVHATIAAVLAAFTIPADVVIKETYFMKEIHSILHKFKSIDPKDKIPILTAEQLHLLGEIKTTTNHAIPPLQRLEHVLHPIVAFIILPVFALANAGISFASGTGSLFSTHVALGVAGGLLIGKVTGVVLFSLIACGFKLKNLPNGMNLPNLIGLGFLASIGFTMSLFITELAFHHHEDYILQAKAGIMGASVIGGVIGYTLLKIYSNTKRV